MTVKLPFKILAVCLIMCAAVIPSKAQTDVAPPVITYDRPEDTVCIQIGSVWTIKVSATDNQTASGDILFTLNWGFNGPVNALIKGSYPVVIEAMDEAGNKSSLKLRFIVDDCANSTGVKTQTISTIQVYPQPAHDILNIQLGNSGASNKLSILTIDGQAVYEATNESAYSIPVAQWALGVYILQVETANATITRQKIILNH